MHPPDEFGHTRLGPSTLVNAHFRPPQRWVLKNFDPNLQQLARNFHIAYIVAKGLAVSVKQTRPDAKTAQYKEKGAALPEHRCPTKQVLDLRGEWRVRPLQTTAVECQPRADATEDAYPGACNTAHNRPDARLDRPLAPVDFSGVHRQPQTFGRPARAARPWALRLRHVL